MDSNKCLFFYILLREKYLNAVKKKILLLEKNNKIVDNKILILNINYLYHFNLKHLLKYTNYNIVYEIDNLIFYDENIKNKPMIGAIIMSVTLYNNEDITDITDNIKKYSLNMPFYIIVNLEKININLSLVFNFLYKCCIKTKKYKINDILNKRLYELLN